MTKDEHIKYWLDSATHDLDTSRDLLEIGRYDWALFIGHLALEKTLKANYVNHHNKIPPKLHNLVRLAELSTLELNVKRKNLLDKINDFNIEVRYPAYRQEFYKICTKEFATENLEIIEDFIKWIESQIK